MNFDSKEIVFPKCDGINGYQKNPTKSSVFKCCSEKCNYSYKYCSNTCREKAKEYESESSRDNIIGRCLGNCRIMHTLCGANCGSIVNGFDINNDYNKCAREINCPDGLGQIPNKECVNANKNVLFNCCTTKCIPSESEDCVDKCQTLQELILNPEKLGLPIKPYPWASARENNKIINFSDKSNSDKSSSDKSSSDKSSDKSDRICLLLIMCFSITVLILLCIILYINRGLSLSKAVYY